MPGRWLLAVCAALSIVVLALADAADARQRGAQSGDNPADTASEEGRARPRPPRRARFVPAAVAAPVVAPPAEATAQPPDVAVPQPQPRPKDQVQPPAEIHNAPPPAAATGQPQAVAAFAVFERHCSGCHQDGRLRDGSALPAGGLGNILDLAALARNGALVTPGDADASPLYQQMVARQMPPDPRRKSANPGEPAAGGTDVAVSVEDLTAVRAWIAGLPTPAAPCDGRPFVDAQRIARDIAAWVDSIGAEAAAGTRFVSLASLANACASDAELAAARQGVVRLLNSLSWLAAPAEIDTVGDDLAMLAFRLGDLGWTPEHWQLLTARLAPASRVPVSAATASAVRTPHPVVPADWLAAAVSDASLYDRLLGLPSTLDELAGIVGVAIDDERESRSARRGAVLRSGEIGSPRFVDRYSARRGAFWVAYDPPLSEADANPLDQPLIGWSAGDADAAEAAKPGERAPRSAAVRVLFELPNGFTAFATYAPTGVDGTNVSGSGAAACLACHSQGPRAFEDALPAHIAAPGFGGSDLERELAGQVAFSKGEIERLVAEQAAHVAEAEAKAAITSGLRLDGAEPVTALAARYRRAVDLYAAAADMLVTAADLKAGLIQVPDAVRHLALRLEYGRLSRDELEALKAAMHSRGAGDPAARPVVGPFAKAAGDTPLRVELWPAERPRKGDELVRLMVKASGACHLTLVNIDAAGKALVLYPNEFDRDNLLKSGEPRLIPGGDATYRFRLPLTAPERFVAVCEEGEPVPAGITPDLTRHNFTALGDWQTFLARAHRAAGEPRVTLENGDDPDRRFRRGRKAAEPSRPAPAVTPAQARAAITLRVEQ